MSDDTGELGFLQLLQTFRRGSLVSVAEERLAELLTAVRETGGAGDLTIKLPVKVNKGGQIEIDPVVTIRKPRRALGTGIYFVTEDGRLSRRDPDQVDWVDDLSARRQVKQED